MTRSSQAYQLKLEFSADALSQLPEEIRRQAAVLNALSSEEGIISDFDAEAVIDQATLNSIQRRDRIQAARAEFAARQRRQGWR